MKRKLSNCIALFCFTLSLVFVGRAILATDSAEASVDLQTVTEVSSELAIKPASVAIEEIRIGDRVLAHNPEESESDRSRWTEPYWDQWLTLDLEMQKEGGGLLQIKLLRSRDWLQAQLVPSSQSALQLISGLSIDSAAEIEPKILAALSAGLAVEMDLPELGLTGHAKVLAIGPPPLVESGAGQVVTATFRHSSVDVIDLTFKDAAGNEETLGTTSNHPFWSEDRQEYVQAGSLKEHERLLTLDGQIQQVVHAESRIAGDPVFNIEVHQEHVYFVGDSNVLVYNMGKGKYTRSIDNIDILVGMSKRSQKHLLNLPKPKIPTPAKGLIKASETIGQAVEATFQGRKVMIRVDIEIGGKLQIQAGKGKNSIIDFRPDLTKPLKPQIDAAFTRLPQSVRDQLLKNAQKGLNRLRDTGNL